MKLKFKKSKYEKNYNNVYFVFNFMCLLILFISIFINKIRVYREEENLKKGL